MSYSRLTLDLRLRRCKRRDRVASRTDRIARRGCRSGPGGLRRQGHENRLDIAVGLEPEQGAAVIDEVEFDITAAADQLLAALFGRPGLEHVAPDEAGIDGEKRLADIAGEGEIPLPVPAVEVIEKNAADPARLVAVPDEEVFIAPRLE